MIRIALACLLTVLIETGFLYFAGFRTLYAGTVVVCANVITNLLVNLCLAITGLYGVLILAVLESLAVAAEYGIYVSAFGREEKLFIKTLAANVISFLSGFLFF